MDTNVEKKHIVPNFVIRCLDFPVPQYHNRGFRKLSIIQNAIIAKFVLAVPLGMKSATLEYNPLTQTDIYFRIY